MNKQSNLVHGSSLLTTGLSNYNQWIVSQLEDLLLEPLSGNVLEFGCGTGGVTRALASRPQIERVFANDASSAVAEYYAESKDLPGKVTFVSGNFLTGSPAIEDYRFDYAVTTNTLEHIEADGEALALITNNALKRTSLVLVPALECLHGTCDQDGGHIRRYSRASFIQMCTHAGLRVERIRYVNLIGALGWWFHYVLLRRHDYETEGHASSYSFFDRRVLPISSRIEKRVGTPFGLSLIAKVSS